MLIRRSVWPERSIKTVVRWTDGVFCYFDEYGRVWFFLRLSWLTFFLLAGIHILSNYYAVRSLSLETFNQARFHLAVTTFFGSGGTFVPSVSAVNYKEPVLLPLPKKWSFDIGCRLPKKSMTIEEFEAMRNIYSTEVYCLHVLPAKGNFSSSNVDVASVTHFSEGNIIIIASITINE